jgi:hypothetical protein
VDNLWKRCAPLVGTLWTKVMIASPYGVAHVETC